MNTVDRAVKLLKQHIKALRVIVSAGEINDAFELQRTLASIHQTFLNNGALSLKFLTTVLDLELYSLLRKAHELISTALDVIRAEIRTNPIARLHAPTCNAYECRLHKQGGDVPQGAEIQQKPLDPRLGCLLSDCMDDACTAAFMPLVAIAGEAPECTRLLAVLREEKALELWVPEAVEPYIWKHTQCYAPVVNGVITLLNSCFLPGLWDVMASEDNTSTSADRSNSEDRSKSNSSVRDTKGRSKHKENDTAFPGTGEGNTGHRPGDPGSLKGFGRWLLTGGVPGLADIVCRGLSTGFVKRLVNLVIGDWYRRLDMVISGLGNLMMAIQPDIRVAQIVARPGFVLWKVFGAATPAQLDALEQALNKPQGKIFVQANSTALDSQGQEVLQVLGTLSVQSLWSCLIRLHSLCIEAELTSDTSALLPILKHTPRAVRLLDQAWSCVPPGLGLDPATWVSSRGKACDLCAALQHASVAVITLAGLGLAPVPWTCVLQYLKLSALPKEIQTDLLKDGSLGRLVVRSLKISGHTMRCSDPAQGHFTTRSASKVLRERPDLDWTPVFGTLFGAARCLPHLLEAGALSQAQATAVVHLLRSIISSLPPYKPLLPHIHTGILSHCMAARSLLSAIVLCINSLMFAPGAASVDAPRLQIQVLAPVTWQLLPLVLPVLADIYKSELQKYEEAQQLHAQRPTIASMVEEEVAKQVMVARLQVLDIFLQHQMAYNMLYTVLARTRQDLLCLAKVLPLLWPISCERAAFTESTDLPPEAPAPAIPVGDCFALAAGGLHLCSAMLVGAARLAPKEHILSAVSTALAPLEQFMKTVDVHQQNPRSNRHLTPWSEALYNSLRLWQRGRAGLQVFAALEAAMSRAEDLHVAEAPYDTVGAKRLMTKFIWHAGMGTVEALEQPASVIRGQAGVVGVSTATGLGDEAHLAAARASFGESPWSVEGGIEISAGLCRRSTSSKLHQQMAGAWEACAPFFPPALHVPYTGPCPAPWSAELSPAGAAQTLSVREDAGTEAPTTADSASASQEQAATAGAAPAAQGCGSARKQHKQKRQQGLPVFKVDHFDADNVFGEHDPRHAAKALHVAEQSQLPLPTSPAYLCEWELGLLGLPVEEQGCFHIGCANSLPPSAAQALDHMLSTTSSRTAMASTSCSNGNSTGHTSSTAVAAAVAAPAKVLHLCSGCKAVRYCGPACQTAAWKAVHKHTCKMYKMGSVLEEMQAAAKLAAAGNEAEQAPGKLELGH